MRNYSSEPAKSRFSEFNTETLASTGKKKVFITERTIKNINLFKYPNMNYKQNKLLQNRQKELLTFSMQENDSNEIAFILSENILKFNGMAEFKLQTEKNLYVLHNHPKGSSFSLNDIGLLITNDKIRANSLITNTGRIEFLLKRVNYDRLKITDILYTHLRPLEERLQKRELDKNQYTMAVDNMLPRVFKLLTKKDMLIWK